MSADSARLWWGPTFRRLETAGFIAAAFAYLLPFLDYRWFRVPGVGVFFSIFQALPQAPSWPLGLYYFSVCGLPLFALAAALLYRRHGTRGSFVRLTLAAVAFFGLGIGSLWSPRPPFAFGYYGAEAGLLLAAVGAAISWMRGGAESDAGAAVADEPALSASQLLLKRSRS